MILTCSEPWLCKNEMPVITAPHSAVFTTFEEYKTEKIIWENDAKGK